MAFIDTNEITIPKGFFKDLNVPKLLEWLNSQPEADVVEVVRCKDCKHYEIGKSYTPYCNNVMNLFEEMKPTHFCSYGESK